MNREYHRWYSPALNRDMELLIFGHGGARVLVFPTSKGKFYEWEDRGMMAALGEHLENGWIQMYCVDSVDEESWYAWHKSPGDRAWRHMQYESYLLHEVLPLASQKNPTPYLITYRGELRRVPRPELRPAPPGDHEPGSRHERHVQYRALAWILPGRQYLL